MKTTLGRFGSTGLGFSRYLGLTLATVLLASCSAGKKETVAAPEPSKPGKVVIRGSNTIGEELAPRLIGEFKKDHPAADFDLQPKATGYGLAMLRAGECDIAAASRMPTKEEMEQARHLNIELADHFIGSYSVAVVVNTKNSITNLTREQVRDIFTGTIQNWKEVGGPDSAIHVYSRDPISGTYLGFKELAMEGKNYCDDVKLDTSYAGIAKTLATDEAGIGYSSIQLPKDAAVKSVSINGIAPTAANVNAGTYPYTRNLHLYSRRGSEAATGKEFVDFVLSAKGQEVLAQTGFVPHP